MRAIVQDRYGGSADLRLADVPVPRPAPDEVLVEVHAASMHADIWHSVTGTPLALRVMGAGLLRPRQPIPGIDLSGRVVEVGDGVTGLSVGDDVFGETTRRQQWTNGGAFAEYAAVPAEALRRKPDRLSHVEAAAIPTSGLIGVQVIEDEGRVRPGQSVLVNGAAGGVGVFAVQVARASQAHVTAVDHSDKLDVLRQLGVDTVIDYTTTDVLRSDAVYDVVVDVAGTRRPGAMRRIVRPGGAYVLVGHDQYGRAHRPVVGSLATFAGMMVRAPFVSQYHLRLPRPRASRMDRLVALIEAGQLVPVVERTYRLDEVPRALDRLATGQVAGKLVIEVVRTG